MSKSDSDYYAARLDEEWRAAKNAGCAAARAAHEAMADLYADRLVQSLEARPTLHVVADEPDSAFTSRLPRPVTRR